MHAAQIAKYMRQLIDDPGIVRLPYSLQATMLEIAYEEYRNLAPWEVWERYYEPPLLTGQYNVDLDGILFYTDAGAPPTQALASRLTRVTLVNPGVQDVWIFTLGGAPAPGDTCRLTINAVNYDYVVLPGDTLVTIAAGVAALAAVDPIYSVTSVGPAITCTKYTTGPSLITPTCSFLAGAGTVTPFHSVIGQASNGILGTFQPATSWETLGQIPNASAAMLSNYAWTGQRYWLDGKMLRFSVPVSGQIQIWYVPTQTVNWLSAISSTTPVFVDNLTQFHDIIALLAAEQYYIQQAQPNTSLEMQLRRRMDKMMEFFAQSRTGKASRYVNEEYQR